MIGPKEMIIHELSDKEFRIFLLKNFSKLQGTQIDNQIKLRKHCLNKVRSSTNK